MILITRPGGKPLIVVDNFVDETATDTGNIGVYGTLGWKFRYFSFFYIKNQMVMILFGAGLSPGGLGTAAGRLCIKMGQVPRSLCPDGWVVIYRTGFPQGGEGMLRFLRKLLVSGIVTLGLAGYGMYLYTGKPPWVFFKGLPAMPKIEAPSLPKLGEMLPKAEPAGQDRLYKWRDEQGQWHYTSEQPAEGIKFELLTIDRSTNVLPGSEAGRQVDAEEKNDSSSDYIGNVVDKARDVKRQLKDRTAKSREALDNL